jgi:hypothetical protein
LENLITSVFRVMLRIVLLALGLVFVASLVLAAAFVFLLWSLRSFWARLRGQPVAPWAFQFSPRAQWGRFYAGAAKGTADNAASGQRGALGAIPDITDVVAKESTGDHGAATK